MITIFDSRAEDFSTLGLCVVQPTECDIEGSENGMMELTMTCPMDAEGRWQNLKCYNIVRAPSPVRETPLIRVTDNPGASEKTVTRTICKVKTYTGKRLRLRAKPSTSAKTLGYYAPGTEVVRLSVSGDWAQVVVVKGGASGWMSNERLQVARTETEIVTVRGKDSTSKVIEPRQTREQLFRICEVKTDDETSMVYVVAKHIFYDLAANTVKGDYSPECAAVGEVCAQMLARALNPHDFTLYCTAEGTVTGDYGRKGIANCLLEDEIGVASQTGAKIILDNFDIFVLKDEVRDNGVEIRHAKNLRGAELTENVEDVITRVVPVGKDKNGDPLPLPNGEYVETPRAASIPVIRSKEIEYDVRVGDGEGEYKTKEKAYAKLRELAAAEFSDNGVDGVTVGLDVDFVALENTTRYQDYAPLQYIHMGDTVRVVSPRSGIDAKLRMTGFTYDAAFPGGGRYKTVKLGQINELRTQVYGFDIARGTMPGTKILPGSVDAQAALRNATIGYAKIAQAAIEQLAADSIVAIRADIHDIVAGSVTTDQLYADIATLAAAQITAANIEKANIDWAAITTLRAEIATIAQAQITTAIIKSADIDWAQIDTLTAKMAEIAQAKIDNAEITSAQIKDLESVVATLFAAKIGSADIGFAQIKDLVAGTAIITEGVGGELYIARLAVTEANMVSLTVGELIVKGEDGGFYALGVDADGNVRTTVKQIANSDVENLSINAGEKLIEGSVTAACLNAKDIFADSAIIRQMIAANIDVGTLFAREAFIAHLNTSDISGNEYLKLTVKDAVDGIQVGGRNLLKGTQNDVWEAYTAGLHTVRTYTELAALGVAAGDVLTYSIDIQADKPTRLRMIMTTSASDNRVLDVHGGWLDPAEGRAWVSAEVPATATHVHVYIASAGGATVDGRWKGEKLEKGNKSTDWSPAPEDAEGEIDGLKERMSSAELKITDSAIVSTVTSSTSYKTLSSTASTAKSTAETAQSTANTAKSTADTAKTKADGNATDITGLKTRMTTAESKIDQKADSITLSVLETKVDGIQVGGRNLLKGTQNDVWEAYTAGLHTVRTYTELAALGVAAGDVLTYSIDIQADKSTRLRMIMTTSASDNRVLDVYGGWLDPAEGRAWVSAEVPATATHVRVYIASAGGATVDGRWKGEKLEKGNKPTDWSPAPEDPAGSLSVNSNYSKVDINEDRVRIVSKRMEVAVPSDDGEDDVLRVDADGVHAEVVEADRIVSESVVHTQGAASYTPANAGELAEILTELSGKHLTGDVDINCLHVTSGNFEVQGLYGAAGNLTLRNGEMNALTVRGCDRSAVVYVESMAFSTSGVAVAVDNAAVMLTECSLSAGTGLRLGANWPSEAWMTDCEGDCTTLATLGSNSRLYVGGIKPAGTLNCAAGSEVYNSTDDPTFTAASSPSIPTTQTVTVSLSPTSTSTSGYGSKLYQGRYSSSQSLRKGVMLFTLPSDLTSADKIDAATLTIKRIGGVGQGGGVSVHVRCYDVPGTLYASKTAYNGQTVSIDVTSAVKAMKTNGYGGLMLYNPNTTTVGSKSYTASYSRFAGNGESGAPVLKISYRK